MSDEQPSATDHAPHADLDVAAEQHRLDELGHRIEATRERAHEDLDMGGAHRTFVDEGVRRQVAEYGDTHHPTGDTGGSSDDDHNGADRLEHL